MKTDLSIVTTSYKSSLFMEELIATIEAECLKITSAYEIIVVDDNSPDNSWDIIKSICLQHEKVKGVKLARNYGQQLASSVALEKAQGSVVILMDGDFENPVSLFQSIYQSITTERYEIVYVTAKERQDIWRKISSSLFWDFCEQILKLKIVKNQLMLRGMSRLYVNDFLAYKDFIRSVAIINYDMGGRSKVIETTFGKRKGSTKSNSNFFKRFDLFVDLVILISTKPLKWIFYLGLICFIISCLFLAYSLSLYFFKNILPGYTSLIASIFLFGGLNLLTLSLVGRYLANVYTEVRKRPLYRAEEVLNF